MSPLANSYLNSNELNESESYFPLRTFICKSCNLVQLEEFKSPDFIFSDYDYFSSYSKSWLNHTEDLVNQLTKKFEISSSSQVIEIASNDGYLLKFFKKKKVPILGIEPAKNIAEIAEKKGIPTIAKFFGSKTAKELIKSGKKADLLIAINVFPHVPNVNDFVSGLKIMLEKNGVVIVQFSAHLLNLLKYNEFDTVYHEHFSYFSLHTAQKIFAKHGLTIFDLEDLSIHGGSLRFFIKHTENNHSKFQISKNVNQFLQKEKKFGLSKFSTYQEFSPKVNIIKRKIWKFFLDAEKNNKKIVGYGAPAKGNTLLNFCGIDKSFIPYTVDLNPHKQGKFLPGTHIPILHPNKIKSTKPDYLLILPWNLKEEIIEQMSFIRDWGGKFVVLIPQVKIIR
jgi:2-polyprenyl-3-methyl-5-hydroxy-6-metoxy-1,4-benzoquinol methylase